MNDEWKAFYESNIERSNIKIKIQTKNIWIIIYLLMDLSSQLMGSLSRRVSQGKHEDLR